MEILKLSDLIGQEIVELRYHYLSEDEFGLQSFFAYLKLKSNYIIDIPKFNEEEYLELSEDNVSYMQGRFDNGNQVNETVKAYFVGQTIVDFYFRYYDNKVDFDNAAYIKLSNGYYLTENNYGPPGITTVDLVILDEKQFQDYTTDVRSFLNSK